MPSIDEKGDWFSLYALQDAHAAHLQEMAKGLPVKFIISASEEEMITALASARVFWQLTGLDVSRLDKGFWLMHG